MGKAKTLIGVFLMILAFVLLAVVVIMPVTPFGEGQPQLMGILALISCGAGEQFVQDFRTEQDLRGTRRGGQVYCVDAAGEERNVTGDLFVKAMVAFLVPFFVGLGLTMSAQKQRQATAMLAGDSGAFTFPSSLATGSDQAVVGEDGTIRFGDMEVRFTGGQPTVVNVETDSQTWTVPGSGTVSGSGDFVTRLKQLQTAYDKGLINRDEYERLRQQILDNMK
jgi:hypothetical protein